MKTITTTANSLKEFRKIVEDAKRSLHQMRKLDSVKSAEMLANIAKKEVVLQIEFKEGEHE